MAANSSMNLASLDFDSLKNNLKTFLKSQSAFSDYDFEGSNMNVLLDILSYNSYLNSFYTNMGIAEGFLDSAQLLSSVISHAKELNYTPRSARSAAAKVSITFNTTSNTGSFEIPKGTQFSGSNANGGFTFVTDENHTLTSPSNVFTINDLNIYEGSYINETFVVDNSIEFQKFVLSNKNIDTTSIDVTVAEAGNFNADTYTQATNLYGLTNSSKVYFVQSTLDGYYEIVFGDGVFGTKPKNESTILVTYRIANGSAANEIKSFVMDKDLSIYNQTSATATVTTTSYSSNGSEEEDIETIRFRAPRHYQTQDRAIVPNDYANIIYENFPEVRAVSVYGGETISGSVQYGKVFIAPISQSGATVTNSVKKQIEAFMNTRNSISIKPVVVDPTFIYIVPSIKVTVDFSQTSYSPADITSIVTNGMKNYNSLYLEKFNAAFRYSKFVSYLNSLDNSIVSVEVSNILKKKYTPSLNVPQPVSVTFNNALNPGTITSSSFLLGDGKIYQFGDYNPFNDTFERINVNGNDFTINNTNKVIYLEQIKSTTQYFEQYGSVDYDMGAVDVKSLTIADFMGSEGIVFFAQPANYDIYSVKNDILEIDINNSSISVVSV